MKIGISKLGMYDIGTWYSLFSNMFKELSIRKSFAIVDAEKHKHIDLLIFDGGADINPSLYQENMQLNTYYYNSTRDSLEVELFSKFFSKSTLYAGICRGCQLLNVLYGGNLIQDLDSAGLHHSYIHNASIVKETKISEYIPKEMIKINSIHHQAVKNLGKNCVATMFHSENKTIEGIETLDGKCRAVQCHPEGGNFENSFSMLRYLFRL